MTNLVIVLVVEIATGSAVAERPRDTSRDAAHVSSFAVDRMALCDTNPVGYNRVLQFRSFRSHTGPRRTNG